MTDIATLTYKTCRDCPAPTAPSDDYCSWCAADLPDEAYDPNDFVDNYFTRG